jgi:hypothetical protein
VSAVFDDFGDPDRSPRSRKIARIAHWMPVVLVVTAGVRIVGWFGDGLVPTWLGVGVEAAMLAVLITLFLHQQLARICLRCMEEVKEDAPIRAQRNRGILKIWHLGNSSRVVLIWLAVLVLTGLGRSWLKDRFGYDWNWLNAPTDVIFLLYVYSLIFHHRVSPWCPYCRRWDEGGEHEVAPTPDPTAVKTG